MLLRWDAHSVRDEKACFACFEMETHEQVFEQTRQLFV